MSEPTIGASIATGIGLVSCTRVAADRYIVVVTVVGEPVELPFVAEMNGGITSITGGGAAMRRLGLAEMDPLSSVLGELVMCLQRLAAAVSGPDVP